MVDGEVAGLVLAAGAGRRMGGPKALLRLSPTGPSLVESTVTGLRESGVSEVHVVVGHSAASVRLRAERAGGVVAEAEDWAEGMGASLRCGIDALEATDARAVILMLVDLPDVGPAVHTRLLESVDGELDEVLVRAAYDGHAGHPVLIGRSHWRLIRHHAMGDHGARTYFDSHPPQLVECGDLASGRDVDRPGDL